MQLQVIKRIDHSLRKIKVKLTRKKKPQLRVPKFKIFWRTCKNST